MEEQIKALRSQLDSLYEELQKEKRTREELKEKESDIKSEVLNKSLDGKDNDDYDLKSNLTLLENDFNFFEKDSKECVCKDCKCSKEKCPFMSGKCPMKDCECPIKKEGCPLTNETFKKNVEEGSCPISTKGLCPIKTVNQDKDQDVKTNEPLRLLRIDGKISQPKICKRGVPLEEDVCEGCSALSSTLFILLFLMLFILFLPLFLIYKYICKF